VCGSDPRQNRATDDGLFRVAMSVPLVLRFQSFATSRPSIARRVLSAVWRAAPPRSGSHEARSSVVEPSKGRPAAVARVTTNVRIHATSAPTGVRRPPAGRRRCGLNCALIRGSREPATMRVCCRRRRVAATRKISDAPPGPGKKNPEGTDFPRRILGRTSRPSIAELELYEILDLPRETRGRVRVRDRM